jgi:hypothetical protein
MSFGIDRHGDSDFHWVALFRLGWFVFWVLSATEFSICAKKKEKKDKHGDFNLD